jgi:glycosyltransferase involved in cell wall biosynthesis
MRIALIVPGGVDRSGEYRVIPALLALIRGLSVQHEVHVFALSQEAHPSQWTLCGAHIHNIGRPHTYIRAVRTICSQHGAGPFDIIQAIWSGSCGVIAVAAGKMLGVPSLIHIAGGELVALPEIGYGGRLTWRGRLREAVILRGASAITAASAPIIRMLAQLGLVAQRIPLGVDLEAWPTREPVRRDPDRPARLLHVASLNLVKDQETLLRALVNVARSGVPFELDVIGEDILHGRIQALADQLGLGQCVRFHGFLPQRQLRPFVEAADVMIVSSRHEAGPLAMLEAAVVGVPTVGTAVGHVVEWAPEAALAVPVGDSAALAVALVKVITDEDLRLSLAREALQRAAREDAAYMAARFQALYCRLLS